MSAPLIRIGLIGAGANTKSRHIPGFNRLPGVQIDSVCNRSESSSMKVANAIGVSKIHRTWEEVITDPDCDAVCIGTWPYMHAEVSIAALHAGKHVLTEARMAMDLAEAKKMLAVSELNPHLVAQIVPSPFTLIYDETIRKLIKDGAIGELREVRIRHFQGNLTNPKTAMSWRQEHRLSGKNILTLGIYHEAVQRWIDTDPIKVSAWGQIHTPERLHWETHQKQVVDLPDQIHVNGLYENGALLNYQFSGVEIGIGKNEIVLLGSLGKLKLDLNNGCLELFDFKHLEGDLIEIPKDKRRGWEVEADFIESIREGKPVELTSFAEGVRYMRLTEAVYESWQAGGVVMPV